MGIGIYMHVTFVLLIVAVGWYVLYQTGSVAATLYHVGLILTVFAIVVLHELGHATAARHYGIKTRDIILLPIGGVARLERMPEDPKQELVVALAGPAVNVVLAAILAGIVIPLANMEQWAALGDIPMTTLGFLGRLVGINIFLAAFNLLPAFPMDGGRVLRAVLALKIDYVKATQIAATVGQIMAIIFGLTGVMYGAPMLILIAVFVYMGAQEESGSVESRLAFRGIPVHRAMITHFETLRPDDSLDRVVEHILAGFQQDFPVTDDSGRVVGVLTRGDTMRALADRGAHARVSDAMQSEFEVADPNEMLEQVFERMQNCACRSLPVVRNGHLFGLITAENVGEFIMVQSALRGVRRGAAARR